MPARCSRASTRIIRAPPTCRSGVSTRSARRTAVAGAALSAPAVAAPEIAALMAPFAPFEAHPVLAVAVSGGRDSLALALLAQDWAGARNGGVLGFAVDHCLRPESGSEAATTLERLGGLGIAGEILDWSGAKPD